MIRKLTREEVLSKATPRLTVGDLKKFIQERNLPDDAPVLIERVHDVYYQKHNWGVYLKEGLLVWQAREENRKILSGEYLDKENYPDIKPEHLRILTEEEIEGLCEQYTPANGCVAFNGEDRDILFIAMHY